MRTYLITDAHFYTHDPKLFEKRLKEVLQRHRPHFALYRDKDYTHYARLAEIFVTTCNHMGTAPLLHNDARLALDLDAYGVHYSSNRLCSIGHHDKGLFKVLSTHSLAEIQAAKALGLDAVTFSPIFASPNKGAPVGLAVLKQCLDTIDIPIIALGGIVTPAQIREVEQAGAWAFASIRYFFPKEFSYV